ncbi:MAG TPA: Wadjet anti-phage system protein JetD domain-containing protein [Streptosporangiaceae bacterium]|nr:Wadjet anti-phage system protein JetD domain-containing protein [Streptosporangiaceae bacterium]
MKTPDQAIADVTARLRRSWAHTVADNQLRRAGHIGGQTAGDSAPPAWPHLFPLSPPGRQELERHFAAYQAETLAWRQWQATHRGAGAELIDATRRVHGTVQAIPTHLRVTDIDAAASLSGREWVERLARGSSRAAALLEQFLPPDLPRMLREVDDWGDVDFALLGEAAAWFRDNDATGLTPRQVPVPGMHAKWLNTRQHLVAALAGLDSLPLAPPHPPRVHLTYLDPQHRASGGRRHDCISLGDHVQLPYPPEVVIISENKDTAVAFPAVTGGVCVEGGGSGGATAAALPWLVEAPLLVYWGDIDAAGFEILDGFRDDGVPAASMLMDRVTFERYERYGTPLDRRGDPLGPGTRRDLPHLDTAECSMYHALTDPGWKRYRRIEQERIPLADALAALRLLQLDPRPRRSV